MKNTLTLIGIALSSLLWLQCSTSKDKSTSKDQSKVDRFEEKTFTTSYKKDIQPLMERSCAPCHFPDNKHDLNLLDTYQKVSKDIVDVLQLVQLPQDEKMFMPYKVKKQPLSEKEIDLIKKWVNEGMPE